MEFGVFKLAALAALLGGAQAFWRLNCANIQYGRIDPIVNPGGIAAHVHTAQGGSSRQILINRIINASS
jgi:hypothetical protein